MTAKIDGPSLQPARTVDATQAASVARAGADRSKPVDAAPAADSVRLTPDAASLSQAVEQQLREPASMDIAKIEAIRASIADGTYQINPGEIATRLIALERQLRG